MTGISPILSLQQSGEPRDRATDFNLNFIDGTKENLDQISNFSIHDILNQQFLDLVSNWSN